MRRNVLAAAMRVHKGMKLGSAKWSMQHRPHDDRRYTDLRDNASVLGRYKDDILKHSAQCIPLNASAQLSEC